MRRKRIIALVICATVGVSLLAVRLGARGQLAVVAAPIGRAGVYGEYVVFSFAVTNCTQHDLEVRLVRHNAPAGVFGDRLETTFVMAPFSSACPALVPPEAGVRWSVDVSCLRHAGKFEWKVRALGARFGICKPDRQWDYVQSIKIAK